MNQQNETKDKRLTQEEIDKLLEQLNLIQKSVSNNKGSK